MFIAIVGSNTELTNVEKLHYLKTNLVGEPEQLTRNIPTTDDNFRRAWDLLCHTYEHKAQLVKAHLTTLFAIPSVTTESVAELKRLLNTTLEVLGALKTLERPVDHWDDILVFMSVERLDSRSRRAWEISRNDSREPSTFPEFQKFLETRIRAVEFFAPSQSKEIASSRSNQTAKDNRGKSGKAVKVNTHHTAAKPPQCQQCGAEHYLRLCPTYIAKPVEERSIVVEAKQLCTNCLGAHQLATCRSARRCKTCNGRHHTSLHPGSSASCLGAPTSPTENPSSGKSKSSNDNGSGGPHTSGPSHVNHTAIPNEDISDDAPALLATAIVIATSSAGGHHETRALLDQGSQISLISERLAQRLNLPRRWTPLSVCGWGGQIAVRSRGIVTVQIASRFDLDKLFQVDAHVVPGLSDYLPDGKINAQAFPHLRDLPLADPALERTLRIELLLGSGTYARLLRKGVRIGISGTPIAQETALGWVLSGPYPSQSSSKPKASSSATILQCTADQKLHDLLQRFWLQEESSTDRAPLTPDELECEHHFNATHRRLDNGRYVVRLPVKRNIEKLGDTLGAAKQVLTRLEKRFTVNKVLQQAYTTFLGEYEALGHMGPVTLQPESRIEQKPCCYLPHHGVFKDTSSTTKLRVVFNASQPSDSSISLNDCLHIGPKLQRELPDVVTRWRLHRIVFAADIEKMYRQIWVAPEDHDLQRILWRRSAEEPIQAFQLRTVTYGVSSAPYLALRTLQQLAQDEERRFPIGAEIIRKDVYVDDVLSGADDLSTALEKQQQVLELLKAGGFNLRKWMSNDPILLESTPQEFREEAQFIQFEENPAFKLLGLTWMAQSDTFGFQVKIPASTPRITKRSVLSSTAQLYDPLGWIAPVVITAKILLQGLWARGLGWDDPLPEGLAITWREFHAQLTELRNVSVPRWLGSRMDSGTMELHGFCDASERAYAAVAYLRSTHAAGETRITLIAAKTKVAPLKRISLPRLELAAATLLARVVAHIKDVAALESKPIYLWSDSSITLHWISQSPSRWKTFIANRTSEIQTLLPQAKWRHVPGADNPADCASRGISPAELPRHPLWWRGPGWLTAPPQYWPSEITKVPSGIDLEERVHTNVVNPATGDDWDLTGRYSSLIRLLRITAWCLRYIQRLHERVRVPRLTQRLSKSPATCLNPAELDRTRLHWIRQVQRTHFSAEINALRSNDALPAKSSLQRLTPFLDPQELLRVGGRLKHGTLSPDERHPCIIPTASAFTILIIDASHKAVLHGGAQQTLAYLRRRYWIPRGRTAVRAHISRCIICYRQRPTPTTQLMGQLPAERITPARPFSSSGVDFAGPIQLRTTKGRGHRAYKGYVAIFVYFATKAVHLEAVTDYTTDGFLAAFKRFTARRGICTTLFSDQGTNFVGAEAQLRNLFHEASRESEVIANKLANDGTRWRFNPPASLHFGGLWEAGVKSVKHHLRRVIGDTTLTYEEMSTFLAQVEACLNSRPLQPLTEDPDDLTVLTPEHFLIGQALTAVPEPRLQDVPLNRLTRWQLTQRMTEEFWTRWSREYLQQLQARVKWRQRQPAV